MTDVVVVSTEQTVVSPIDVKILSVDIINSAVVTIDALGGYPVIPGSKVYAQESRPGTNIEGDVWFNPVTETIQVLTAGVWVPHGHDDGFF